MRGKKVAIDTGPLDSGHSIRGIGVHTRELINALQKNKHKDFDVEGVDFGKANLTKFDILHYPYFHPYFLTLPGRKSAKGVVLTIHDLIPLIYPKSYPPGIKGKLNFLIQRYRLKDIDAIITISETSKKDICRFLGTNPDKVYVVYLAPKNIFKKLEQGNWGKEIAKRYNLPDRFVLYVGDINYNKNLINLVKSAKKANIHLVIVGKRAVEIEKLSSQSHPELVHLNELAKELDDKRIIRLGFVPDEDLPAIYSLASIYCQPSFYEGFGLPLLEAMASGCPVVASEIQAHKEVAGDAALFADPDNVESFVNQFERVIKKSDIRSSLIKKGLAKAKEYSWEKTALNTLEVYKKIF